MKARIKASGAVIEVMHVMGGFNDMDSGIFYESEELDYPFFESELSTIDWEQRRWDASVAAMQGLLTNRLRKNVEGWELEDYVDEAIRAADYLVEMRKPLPDE